MNRKRALAGCGFTSLLGLLGSALLHSSPALGADPTLVRGPYLQLATSTNITVRWRTDLPTASRVAYGTNLSQLEHRVEGNSATNHIVVLNDLWPDTFYYYSIGTPTLTLASGSNYCFRTAPPPGSRRPLRVWVLGDFGFTNQSAVPVRNAYDNFTANRYTDVWLMLGDNAYHGGSDSVWQAAVFDTYSNRLRQTPVWSTIGNQETFGQPTVSDSAPYFANLTLPVNGEGGGVASGTEKYYSFDYGNVHFVCLDSMTSGRTDNSAMLQWLETDLAANSNDWLIAFWHHPPYSKGSNDSDTRNEQIEMRRYAVPLLEAYGVDLVLAGHSHSYERSFFIDGHYGTSSTFSTNMVKDGGDGRADGSGAYDKTVLGPLSGQGAIYAVAGSGASLGGGALNHPAMFRSLNRLGSMVLDIHANRLEAKFLRETGIVDDYFTLIKGAAALRISAVRLDNGRITLSWPSVAGRTYRVEILSDLAPSWTNASDPLQGTGVSTSWSGTVRESSRATYYRVWSAED